MFVLFRRGISLVDFCGRVLGYSVYCHCSLFTLLFVVDSGVGIVRCAW